MSNYPHGSRFTAFIDDGLGVETGGLPLIGGRAGWAMHVKDRSRQSYFHRISLSRHLG
jgi:hypothetical protein